MGELEPNTQRESKGGENQLKDLIILPPLSNLMYHHIAYNSYQWQAFEISRLL
jgi:hypothetical protein